MTTKINEIKQAAESLKSNGLEIPQELGTQLASLDNPQYRIAVVGMYEVGKSTLINKVFLDGKSLLKEGRGLCTTAVATEIEYGPERLEVYHWDADGETLATSVENPTAEDVDKATAASTMNDRKALAKKISRVRLLSRNDTLRNYTIIDTPGLDDPEKDLLINTTYRVIPSADAALVVVECRMLTDIELNLLSKDIAGKSGIQKMMVLVSCKPKNEHDEESRKDILTTIQAQLAGIGRSDIPVEMYCFDPSVTDIMSEIPEIRLTIRSFLEQNAQAGREEKVSELLRREVEKRLYEVAAKLKAATISDEEKKALSAKIASEVEQFKTGATMAFEQFKDGIGKFQESSKLLLSHAVDEVFDKFLSDIKIAHDITAMQEMAKNAEPRLKSELSDKLAIVSMKIGDDFNHLIESYQKEAAKGGNRINTLMASEFNVRTPVSAKIPKTLIRLTNWGVGYWLFPMSFLFTPVGLTAVLLWFAGNPVKFTVKKVLLFQVSKALEQAKGDIKLNLSKKIDEYIMKTYHDVKSEIESYNHEQVAILESSVNVKAADVDTATLEPAKASLESALATLAAL